MDSGQENGDGIETLPTMFRIAELNRAAAEVR